MQLDLIFTISLETCYFINVPESHRDMENVRKVSLYTILHFFFIHILKKSPGRGPQGRSWSFEGGVRRRWSVGQWSGRGNASHGGRPKVW